MRKRRCRLWPCVRRWPDTNAELIALTDYCETDVAALGRLFPVMLPGIDLPRSLLRGRFMAANSAIEFAGTPIDVTMKDLFLEHWTGIQDELITEVDVDYGVFDGRTFKADRWAQWLIRNNIPWPLLESGQLDLEDKTFREMAKAYPAVSPMRELRHALSDLRLNDLAVGRDGRNRTVLWAFQSKTGRTQPSNTQYIFGPSVWLRGLIKPPPGLWSCIRRLVATEFGIAAALSGDREDVAAYLSGDCYLTFGQQAGAIPPDATKKSHGAIRELFKQCVLGVQYGMGSQSLALKIAQPSDRCARSITGSP